MYMDDIKLFTKNEKELETLIVVVRTYRCNLAEKNAPWKVENETLRTE